MILALGPTRRDLIDQFVRHGRHRFALLAAEVEVLDLLRRVLEAQALGVGVVEVLVARAHAADVEAEAGLDLVAALLDVVAHHYRDEGCHVEVFKLFPLPALAKPFCSDGSSRSKRSGFIHTGMTPSATSAEVSMPAGAIDAV